MIPDILTAILAVIGGFAIAALVCVGVAWATVKGIRTRREPDDLTWT